MFYVGLDVHSNRSSLEILDHDGKRIKRLKVRGPWSALGGADDREGMQPYFQTQRPPPKTAAERQRRCRARGKGRHRGRRGRG